MQSHKCFFLGTHDQCRGDGHCQYKLVLGTLGFLGPIICGKDQIVAIQADREPEFDGTEITIGGQR
jgi:hypothetical protein